MQVFDNIIMTVDMQNRILEVALELHPRPVHLRELSEYLVLWRIFLLFLRLIIIVLIVVWKIKVVILHDKLAFVIQVDIGFCLETGSRHNFRLLLENSRRWSIVNIRLLLHFLSEKTLLCKLLVFLFDLVFHIDVIDI